MTWIIGFGPVGQLPKLPVERADSWDEGFYILRALWYDQLDDQGVWCIGSSANSLAFAQGYVTGQDFMFFCGLTKLNFFIMTEKSYADYFVRH